MDNGAMTTKNALPMNQSLLLIAIAALSLGGGYWLSHNLRTHALDTSPLPANLQATVLDKPRPIKDFQLQAQDGSPFGPATLKGHWSFMFFGYTNCPDVCPTALQVMKDAWQRIPRSQGKHAPRMYFVSVDPDRDSLDTLKKYVQYFDPSFIGVTGKADEIDKLTGQLGVLYGFEDKQDGNDYYTVNHSAQIILIDPNGRMHAVISPPYDGKLIAGNFQAIRQHFKNQP